MSAITGLLGLGGGAGGTSANVVDPTNAGQLNSAQAGVQSGLGGQQQLLSALQGQNGLGNQSQVYNQLQGVVNGTGPNPAQAQLAQSTGQNVAAQSALMAGQRGAASNPGLIARQAAQQGAATQQQGVGQAATLQANQSLNALNSAGQLANSQATNQIGQTNANTQANQANQNALLGAQANVNSVNGQVAGQQATNQPKILGGLANAAGAALGLAQGGAVPGSGAKSRFGQMLAAGGSVMKSSGQVPGKAEVAGNSYANDKVKALLSPGEGVIDRETMQDKGPMGQAARKLIAAIEAKKGKK